MIKIIPKDDGALVDVSFIGTQEMYFKLIINATAYLVSISPNAKGLAKEIIQELAETYFE